MPASSHLTEKQLEALSLAARGMTNAQIANEMDIGAQTVKNYIREAYKRLGQMYGVSVTNRMQAIMLASAKGLIDPPTTAKEISFGR